MDWLDLLAVQGALESSPTPQFKSTNSLVLSFLYGLTLTYCSWASKGMTEDEMVGWHHRLNGHEFEQALGDSDG